MSKIIVTGGRKYGDKDTLFRVLDELQEKYGRIGEIVQGGATGADSLARQWAKLNVISSDDGTGFACTTWVTTFKPNWLIFGKAAGPMRNTAMVAAHRDAQALVAFPGNKGTANCVAIAKKNGVPVILVAEDGTYTVEGVQCGAKDSDKSS